MKKICYKCGIEKDLSEFSRDKTRRDGYQYICKTCKNECGQVLYQANKDKVIKRTREYQKANKAQIKKQKQEYYQANKDRILTRIREYRKANKEQLAKQKQEYHKTPNGKMAKKHAEHNRRALTKNVEVTLTAAQWAAIIEAQGNRCNVCGGIFTKNKRKPTMDHIIPLSEGGGLTFENVQALCGSCNSIKHAKLDRHFIQTWSHKSRSI